MEKMMHLAAQYLAAAGISFLDKKDDSHTSLKFISENGSLSTKPLSNEGSTLLLHYEKFVLEWKTPYSSTFHNLDGTTHEEVLRWMAQMALSDGMSKAYGYRFHYKLPYAIKDNFTFRLTNTLELGRLRRMRVLADIVLEVFMKEEPLHSEINVWPHHFDIGAFAVLKKNPGYAVGLGLAIPDSICADHYFYLTVYRDNLVLDPSSYCDLRIGEWSNLDFKGAILPVTGTNEFIAYDFFENALLAYNLPEVPVGS